MGRRLRSYTPGGIFHLTARTIRRERRIDPALRTAALDALADAVPRAGVRLLAVAIMSNHLHLIVQQGDAPLAKLMQPYLRRLAHLLQHRHSLRGPMLWREYGSRACLTPYHARNAIAYVHLNPVRAGLCGDPAEYPWTSHALFAGGSPRTSVTARLEAVIDPALALPLFGAAPDRSLAALRADYRAFMKWRLHNDRLQLQDVDDDEVDAPPLAQPLPSSWGVDRWGAALSPLFHDRPSRGHGGNRSTPATVPDLASIAANTLARENATLSMGEVRGRGRGPELVRLRHAIIRRLHLAGYPNTEIAGYLGLSNSAVSKVIRHGR